MKQILFDKLSNNLKEFVHSRGFEKVVIGVSGGIDSAVVLCLAHAAFGTNNVIAVTMPSKHTSGETLKDAYELAKNLGINNMRILVIEPLMRMYVSEFEAFMKPKLSKLPHENLQARIRGNILMTVANQENALVLATGNKTEAMMGYCTLYGDTVGAVEVIGNLYKCQVYKLAKEINWEQLVLDKENTIPQSIIDRPPSAELSDGQTDEEDMGISYEQLDKILMRIEDNAFKLEQCPPALSID